jgi:hypothetical protein
MGFVMCVDRHISDDDDVMVVLEGATWVGPSGPTPTHYSGLFTSILVVSKQSRKMGTDQTLNDQRKPIYFRPSKQTTESMQD